MLIIRDWFQTMGKMIIKPSPASIREEAKKAKGKSTSVYFLLMFLYWMFDLFFRFVIDNPIHLYLSIILSLLLPIAFFFYVFFINFLHKRLFHRKKDCYEELLYLLAAILFVVCVLLLPSFIIPYGDYASLVLFGYMFYLTVLILRSLTNLKLWQSIVTIFFGMIIGASSIVCVPTFILNVSSAVPRLLGG